MSSLRRGFTWNKESISDHEDYSGEWDFLNGFLAPILITFFGILIVVMTIGIDYGFFWGILMICLCPVWALGIGIYGHIQMRRSLSLGAFVSAAFSMTIILFLEAKLNFFSWF